MRRAPDLADDQEIGLLQAKRLKRAAREATDRNEILGLLAECEHLIHMLAQEMRAIDREINRISHQARAISAYDSTNRGSCAMQTASRVIVKGEGLP